MCYLCLYPLHLTYTDSLKVKTLEICLFGAIRGDGWSLCYYACLDSLVSLFYSNFYSQLKDIHSPLVSPVEGVDDAASTMSDILARCV